MSVQPARFLGAASALVSATLLGACALLGPRPDPGGNVHAFVGVNVIPMDGRVARVLVDYTVLVRDGRIEQLGPSAQVALPTDAHRISGAGRFLVPGFVDTHMHLLSDTYIAEYYAADELLLALANGVTSARIPIGRPGHLELRRAIARGACDGPTLYVASPQLAGSVFGRRFIGRAVTDEAAGVRAVRDYHAAGYDEIKLSFGLSRSVYDAIARCAGELGMRLIGQVPAQVGLERALAVGQQIEQLDQYLEALLSEQAPSTRCLSGVGVWERECWETLDHIDVRRIPALAAQVVAANVWSSPTLHFLNSSFGYGRSEGEIAESPDARFVSHAVRAELLRGRGLFWSDPPAIERRARYVELRNALTRAIHAAGGKLMSGTEAPEWLLLPGFSLHRELESLVAAGLTPYDALETTTRNPAEWFGALDEFGTIEPEKRADLLLLGANPLEDITNTRKIEGVMLRGRWFSEQRLRDLLELCAAELSRAPLEPARPAADGQPASLVPRSTGSAHLSPRLGAPGGVAPPPSIQRIRVVGAPCQEHPFGTTYAPSFRCGTLGRAEGPEPRGRRPGRPPAAADS